MWSLRVKGLVRYLPSPEATALLPDVSGKRKIKQWILRENAKQRRSEGDVPRRGARVVELEANWGTFCVRQLQGLLDQQFDATLCVLPGSVVTESRGFVPFTCRAMATLLQMYNNEDFLLVADAKVGKGERAWRVATIGFLGKSGLHRSSLKRLGAGGRVQSMVYTTSCRPVVQALFDQETNDNWVALFDLFLDLGALVLGISREHFAASIMRLHKDVFLFHTCPCPSHKFHLCSHLHKKKSGNVFLRRNVFWH